MSSFVDHEFDPVTPEEEARRQEESDFARRVRREVRRINSGEADEDIRADEAEEAEERARREAEEQKKNRRQTSTFWQVFSGTFLVREDMFRSYPYLLAIAVMFLVSIMVIFASLHADVQCAKLEREVQVLHERALYMQQECYRKTAHSAVVEELKRRGLDLQDPPKPGTVIPK